MEFSEMLNWILGGGLLAAVVGLLTLKATVDRDLLGLSPEAAKEWRMPKRRKRRRKPKQSG
jgi:hypothetical protein